MEDACMSSYDIYREYEPLFGVMLVLFFLGLIFIPKGKVKKVLYHIYCGFVVLAFMSMGHPAGTTALAFVACLSCIYGTGYCLYVGRKGPAFLFFIGTVISGLCFYHWGVLP